MDPAPMRPSYRLLAIMLSELAVFVRGVATSALGIPGRVRFRMLKESDKAAEIARQALDEGDEK